MNPTIDINQRVSVITTYYDKGDVSKASMPCKMRYGGQDITFTELSLRHPTVKGKRMIHVYHVSDGLNGYRLEFDAERLTWILVSMISGDNA